MSPFETFGADVTSTLSGVAEQTASTLISNLQTPVLTALTVYFLLKGFLILAGRIDSPVVDFVITAAKIAIITFIGFQTFSYVNYVIPFVQGLESLLVSSIQIPSATPVNNAWAAIDGMWNAASRAWEEIGFVWDKLPWNAFPQMIMFGATVLAAGALLILLTSATVGVLLINEISLTLVLSFGPLFICLLFFPITRSWFDGWIKSVVTYVFVMVMMTAVLMLIVQYFEIQLNDVRTAAILYDGDSPLSAVMLPCGKFMVIALVSTTLVRLVPSIAAGITGGTALQAVGLGQMTSGAFQTGRALIGAPIAGFAATGMWGSTGQKTGQFARSMMGFGGLHQPGAAALAMTTGAIGSAIGLSHMAIKGYQSGKALMERFSGTGRAEQAVRAASSMANSSSFSSQSSSTTKRASTETSDTSAFSTTLNPETKSTSSGQFDSAPNSFSTFPSGVGNSVPHRAPGTNESVLTGQANPGTSPSTHGSETAARNMDSATGLKSLVNSQQQSQTATRLKDVNGQSMQNLSNSMMQQQPTTDRIAQQNSPKANETPEETIARMNAEMLAKYGQTKK